MKAGDRAFDEIQPPFLGTLKLYVEKITLKL
jgi:hypothetical protein